MGICLKLNFTVHVYRLILWTVIIYFGFCHKKCYQNAQIITNDLTKHKTTTNF